jgi:hypothetical protein
MRIHTTNAASKSGSSTFIHEARQSAVQSLASLLQQQLPKRLSLCTREVYPTYAAFMGELMR